MVFLVVFVFFMCSSLIYLGFIISRLDWFHLFLGVGVVSFFACFIYHFD